LLGLLLREDENSCDDENHNLLQQELDLVHSAIFTEPDDQTAWWYYRFLIVSFGEKTIISKATLERERDTIMELNEAEEMQLKWAWLGLHVVLTELTQLDSSYKQEMDACLEHLITLDPDRVERYLSMKRHNHE
jgi:geranylgeranyl transferase type-2 subunit alpha